MRTHCFASGEFESANKTFAEATYAAFLQNAKNVAGGIPRVGSLGWYAMPLQDMGFETGFRAWVEKAVGVEAERNRTRLKNRSERRSAPRPGSATHGYRRDETLPWRARRAGIRVAYFFC
jgi:hypothetical protein